MADTERLMNKAQGDDIISALATIAANILQVPSEKLIIDWSYTTLPASGNDHTIYAIPTGDADDPWDFYVWNDVDEEWVQFDWNFAVDSTLSTTSENPVQNKVVTEALNGKVDAVTGKGLSANDYTNEEKALVATIPDKADADDVAGTQTATGNPITLNDAAPINAESLVVELEPIQDLHGQDAPYVGGAGKNKLPMTVDGIKAANTDGTWTGNAYALNGVTFTILTDDGGNVTGISVNGTASADVSFTVGTAVSSGATYTFNGCPSGGSENTYYASVTYMGNDIGQGNYNKTIEQGNLLIYSIKIKASATVTNQIFYPMIILSTSTTTFAPYSNICPITGYTECEVDDVGFNQWDEEWELGDYDNSGQATSGDYCIRSKQDDYIPVLGNTVYYAKSPEAIYPCFYDIDKTFISKITVYAYTTFTTPVNARYMRFVVHGSYGTTYNHDICINISKTEGTPKNGDYVPYHFSNATIQFGQTVYGGEVDFLTGVLTVDWASVDLGSLDWVYSGGFFMTDSINTTIKRPNSTLEFPGVMCEKYSPQQWQTNYDKRIAVSPLGNTGTQYYLWISDSSYNDVTAFKNSLNGVPLVYELATPTTIQLTPEELKLLKQYNNITTNGTTINLGYQPDNVIGEVKGEIEQHLEMPYLRILDNDVDTEIKNYRLYYKFISSAYTLVNLEEMLRHRFLFVEVIRNPSGTANHELLHSALIDPRTIDGFEYGIDAGSGDTICIQSIIAENKFELDVRYTGSHTSGDPTDYYVTIRMVD